MSDRRTVRPVLRIAAELATLLASIVALASPGCSARDPEPAFGDAPPVAPLLLADADAEIEPAGDARSGSPSPSLARWLGPELDAWTRESVLGAVRFASPGLGPNGLADAGALRARLRPGGATKIVVIPWLSGDQVDREQRMLRRIELTLDRDAPPDAAIDVEVDLFEALHGNFGDAGRGGRLERLEIALPGARDEDAELVAVEIDRHHALDSPAAAGRIAADHGGVLRPSWFVRGGGVARLEIDVPEDAPELRWYDASMRGAGARVVEVTDGDDTIEIARAPASTGALGAPWTPRRVSLERFAGRRVALALRVDGSGVGLFGEPRVLSAPVDRPVAPSTPDVLVYMIDTLRADKLGHAGNAAPAVSPTIDRLAAEGARFDLALSSSPWTKPAIATLLSGILPTTHGVGASTYTDRMPRGVPLLQERFRAAGWRTGSFAASPLGSTLSALDRGFGSAYPPRFWNTRARLAMNPSATQLHDALLAWIDELPDEPFFAYVHTLEVHEWKLARYGRDLPEGYTSYDAAILDADRQLGALLDALAERRRERALVVVVVSDHGESWGDHDLPSHGFGLYQSQIHVPMIFWSSDGRVPARRIDAPVSLADLAPTLLDGFGLGPLEHADGRSLVAFIEGRPEDSRPVLSALLRFVWAPLAPRQFAVTMPDRTKLIRKQQGELVFDLTRDPAEVRPLDGEAVARSALDGLLAEQRERAKAFAERYGAAQPGAVTADAAARLRALGYLDDGASAGAPEPSPGVE